VASALGITRQAVDKRRGRRALLAVPNGSGEYVVSGLPVHCGRGNPRSLRRFFGRSRFRIPWTQLSVLLASAPALGGKIDPRSAEIRRDLETPIAIAAGRLENRRRKARMTPKPALPKRLPLSHVKAGTRWMRIHAQGQECALVRPWLRPPADSSLRRSRWAIPGMLFRDHSRGVLCRDVSPQSACKNSGARRSRRVAPSRLWKCAAICDSCRFTVRVSPDWG
jgi:hypothetical protein